jgi:hypothetical protein
MPKKSKSNLGGLNKMKSIPASNKTKTPKAMTIPAGGDFTLPTPKKIKVAKKMEMKQTPKPKENPILGSQAPATYSPENFEQVISPSNRRKF